MNASPDQIMAILEEARNLHSQGRMDDALQKLAEAEKVVPRHPQTLVQLAYIYRDTDRLADAIKIFEDLAAAFPDNTDLKAELAFLLLKGEDNSRAYEVAKEAHENAPGSAYVLEKVGRVATGVGRWMLARECFEKLVEKEPEQPLWHRFKANALQRMMRYEEAAETYLNILELEPLTVEHAKILANLYFSARMFDRARSWFEKAIEIKPDELSMYTGLAHCCIQLGEMKRAEELVRKVLEIRPGHAFAFVLLNDLRPDLDRAPHAAALEKKIAAVDFADPSEEAICHLFLGKYYHREKDFEKAFRHFEKYNKLRFQIMKNQGVVYDPVIMEENFRETRRIFSREGLKKLKGVGNDTNVPVFIVGMPRSGTTLLEQILATHSKVHGAGESSGMGRIFFDLNYLINEDPARDIYEIIRAEAGSWAKQYISLLKAPEGDLRVTDKMPLNFLHLGLVQTLFPNARVIHIKRSPLDTCLSMYSNFFRDSYAQSARFQDLGHYYNLYRDLMKHWEKVLSMKFMEIQYEDLVMDPEGKVREVLAFCGLDWEPKVMEYYKGKKAAYTLSQIQVSRPINKSSIGRWKPYEKHIRPLIEALDESIVGPLSVTGEKAK